MRISRTSSLVVALVAVAGLSACGQGGSADSPTSEPSSQESTTESPATAEDSDSAAAPLELTADGSLAGKCAMPSADRLATFDTAFEGTVTALADGTATLTVDQWYAGGDGADSVTVTTPGGDLTELLTAVEFQEGRTYLVSATDGRVSLCGFSAEKTDELDGLYKSAFAA